MPLVNPSFDKLSTGLHRIVIEQRKNKSCLGVDIPYWCYISELVKFDRKKVNEFLLNLEKEIIHKYPAGNDGKVNLKDSLTARYQHYNFLTLRSALLSEVQKHIKKTIKGCIDSFNQGGRKIPMNDLWIICWYNVLRKGEKIDKHNHVPISQLEQSFLSGHFTLEADSTYTHYMSVCETDRWRIKNIPGQIVMFPSYCPHYSDITTAETPRISVAFDVYDHRGLANPEFIKKENCIPLKFADTVTKEIAI